MDRIAIGVVVLSAGLFSAQAQQIISAKPGLLAYTEGEVFLDEHSVSLRPTQVEDIPQGGVVRTGQGRAEILLNPGVFLRLGEESSFRVNSKILSDARLELLTGSAVIQAEEINHENQVTVTCGNGAALIVKEGVYRFDTAPAQVRVYSGKTAVQVDGKNIDVSGGRLLALGTEAADTEKFDRDDTDALDRWSRRRGTYLAMANVSAARQMEGASLSRSIWQYNPYFGMVTFIPSAGTSFCRSGYGLCFFSPLTVERFFAPRYPAWNSYSNRGGAAVGNPMGRATLPGSSSGPMMSGGGMTRGSANSAPPAVHSAPVSRPAHP